MINHGTRNPPPPSSRCISHTTWKLPPRLVRVGILLTSDPPTPLANIFRLCLCSRNLQETRRPGEIVPFLSLIRAVPSLGCRAMYNVDSALLKRIYLERWFTSVLLGRGGKPTSGPQLQNIWRLARKEKKIVGSNHGLFTITGFR